jgi:DNA-binding MarR family transcriptional regulator
VRPSLPDSGAQREGARALTELLRPAGLTAAQAEVLAVVDEANRPLGVRQIGERLVCEGGSPSRLVASVVDAGLLERGERAGDRRAVELSLTAVDGPRSKLSGTRSMNCMSGSLRR